MATLFISDLHLGAGEPHIADLLLRFLGERASQAEALYVLGDLFEVWLGDDAVDPGHLPVLSGMRALSARVPLYFMRGNRDFLAGEVFAAMSGCQLLADPCVIDLYGEPTLLMHGDTLCTEDVNYQQFRAMVRNPAWQQHFLQLPTEKRAELARQAREQSMQQTRIKTAEIMDVTPHAVEQAMREHAVSRLIHGHTHRPGIHHFSLDQRPAQRIVLGDWYHQGSVLICDTAGCRLESF